MKDSSPWFVNKNINKAAVLPVDGVAKLPFPRAAQPPRLDLRTLIDTKPHSGYHQATFCILMGLTETTFHGLEPHQTTPQKAKPGHHLELVPGL